MSNILIQNLLADYGYEIVALPKADIKPLLLLRKEGDALTSMNSDVELLFQEDMTAIPLPATSLPAINGKQALKFNLEAGVDFLSGIFKATRLTNSEIKAAFADDEAINLVFSFENIQEEKINLLVLDNYISSANPLEDAFKSTMELLIRSELYIVTNVLKSNQFSVKIENAQSSKAELSAKVAKMMESKVNFKQENGNNFSIETKSEAPLVFAYKAVQILYNENKWYEFWKSEEADFRIKNQKGMVLKGIEDFPAIFLKTASGIADI